MIDFNMIIVEDNSLFLTTATILSSELRETEKFLFPYHNSGIKRYSFQRLSSLKLCFHDMVLFGSRLESTICCYALWVWISWSDVEVY